MITLFFYLQTHQKKLISGCYDDINMNPELMLKEISTMVEEHQYVIAQKNKLLEYASILETEIPKLEIFSDVQDKIDFYEQKWEALSLFRQDVETWMNKPCIKIDIQDINETVLLPNKNLK